jgi:glycosyltransferase involved in cell wall biosynthesis
MDAAYQALLGGCIPNDSSCMPAATITEVLDVGDNYRFVRKYFATHWYFYILFLRLLTLNNPFRELWWFIKNYRVARFYPYSGKDFSLISVGQYVLEEQPFVSIVIPTLNRYSYLHDVLIDLEKQDYPHFEVLICDQSESFDESFYHDWKLDIKLIRQDEKALWLARNTCIRRAKGQIILLFDDDSRVEPDWIRQHLFCLVRFNSSISAGVTHTIIGHGLSPKEDYYHLSDVFDTGNSMVKREVFEKVGLFDRQFEKQRMGDGEFGLRALLAGYQLISNPYAKRIHLKVETGGLRQMGSWDAFRPKGILAPRPVPSVFYLARKYFGNASAALFALQNIPFSFIPYKLKKYRWLKLIFVLFTPFLVPVMIFDGLISWQQSTKKLKQGALIETLF